MVCIYASTVYNRMMIIHTVSVIERSRCCDWGRDTMHVSIVHRAGRPGASAMARASHFWRMKSTAGRSLRIRLEGCVRSSRLLARISGGVVSSHCYGFARPKKPMCWATAWQLTRGRGRHGRTCLRAADTLQCTVVVSLTHYLLLYCCTSYHHPLPRPRNGSHK